MYSRFVSVFLCILLASGCSTVTPVEMTPEQVQKKISLGDDIEIPIEEVVAIETKEFSAGKTAALAGGTVLLWAIIVAVALGGTLAL
jgi:hypothetical protein